MILIIFLIILINVYLLKKYHLNDMFINYLHILSCFFAFRFSVLYYEFDEFIPSEMKLFTISEDLYYIAIFCFMTWCLVFISVHHFFHEKKEIKVQSRIDILPSVIASSVIAHMYFFSVLNGAGSISNVIYFVRLNNEFHFSFLNTVPAISLMFSVLYYSINKGNFLLFNILILIFEQIILGDRSGIIFSVMLFFIAYNSKYKVKYLITSIPIVFVVASALKSFRSSYQLNMVVEETNIINEISHSLNLNVYDGYIAIISYVNSGVPLRYGQDFILAVQALIPRFLWSDKPEIVNTGVFFAQYFSNRQMGVPISSLGEWFWNFGYIGFIFGPVATFAFIYFLNRFISRFSDYYFGLSIIAILHVIQTGFTNVSFRECTLFIVLLYVSILYKRLNILNANFVNK